jgi:hypothetical protein
MVVANTADDFQHLGLWISPDLDTLMYTLADLADPERGWGRRDETWTFLQSLDLLGPEGTVIDLSWYGDAEVRLSLGGAFHSRRLGLRASQVGTISPARGGRRHAARRPPRSVRRRHWRTRRRTNRPRS